ncbi:MAG: hypothetical protein GYB51_16970, partial [Rhodobacteraceae bacterium]|nr:hypothetical protein [Paracoccaceae bacterium]
PGSGASASLSAPSGVTNGSGQVSITATANGTAGGYNVTASSGALTPVDFALTNTAGPAASLAVSSGSGQSTAVSTAFASALVVTVTDAGGNPVAGETVSFAAPGSGASASLSAPSGVTNGSGQVSITATANGTAGGYNVTASSGALTPVDFALTNTAGPAASLAVSSGSGQSTAVSTAFASALVVTVTDAGGNPVAGETVSFSAPGSGASASLSAPSGVTNGSGQVSITATANSTAGGYNVTASSGALTPVDFALTNTAGPAASLAVSSGSGQSTAVSTAFASALVVTVTDAGGNPVAGETVSFSAPGSGASASLSAASGVTDGSGQVSITATANSTAGGYNVTASSGALTPVDFALTNTAGPAASLAVSSGSGQSTAVSTAFASALVVTVTDAGGNPVAGETVSFSAPGSGASASLSAPSGVTNGAGQVSITATANSTAGGYNVTASSGALTPVDFALTNTAGPAASLAVSSGSGQSTAISTAFASALVVTVTDAGGNPVAGETVSFAAPGSGASASLSAPSGVTNGAGQVSITATANSTAGGYNVTASSGALTPVDFALTNLDTTAPTVVLGAGASDVLPGETFDVTAQFSETVVGFILSDVAVVNGTATGLTGSGASYVITVEASGAGTTTVALPAGVVEDLAGNGNLASSVVSVSSATVSETTEILRQYLTVRAGQLIRQQPDLTRLLSQSQRRDFSADVSRGQGQFHFSGTFGPSVWADLRGAFSTLGDSESSYVLGAIGTHMRVNENLLAGVMLEFDHLVQDLGAARNSGSGWLVGPYVVGRVPDQAVYFEGRLLYGQSRNDISPFGTYSDRVETERMLVMAKVSGELTYPGLTLIPNAELAWASDRQSAYRDSLGNAIPAQRVELGELALGLDFEAPLPDGGAGELLLTGGISAIGRSTSYSGGAGPGPVDLDRLRGKVELGVDYTFGAGDLLSVTTFYDGIGTPDYESYGIEIGLDMRF